MSEPSRVELTVLGETLTLRSAAAPEHLRALAAFLEERVGELERGGVRDRRRALIMAALDIADELFRAREDTNRDADLLERLGALRVELERATPSDVR
ncbi:MAG TPA: cell division protein ZapA [Methylomirabilota bacterium]|jgi:cell division protein ZapA (FtsZ GTPase activity inhibitor)